MFKKDFKLMLFFWIFYSSKNQEKCITSFDKSITCFNHW